MLRAQHSRVLLATILFLPGAAFQDSKATRPVDVFKDLEGHWAGTFVGYDTTGKELYRIRVKQWYRTVNATTQEVRLEDTMADGTVVTGKGQNVATRTADGRLRLSCRVKKSNGDRVEHEGRLVRGPGGDRQIVWFTKTFREWVVGNKADRTYHIHGLGNYDGQLMMMAGRYRIQD
jgi:hypothetical protein